GSTFTVCLPRVNEPTTTVTGDRPEHLLAQKNRSLRVLIVDDNVDGALTLTLLLEAAGHSVLVEHHPKKALERAATDIFDVCLLDIGSPDIDGNELARRLREQPGTSTAVLIALTGYGQDQDRNQTLEAGFLYHLVKPVEVSQLIKLLAHLTIG
ncbi:MAG: response regulator, partial [Cytophagaceae bacterium]